MCREYIEAGAQNSNLEEILAESVKMTLRLKNSEKKLDWLINAVENYSEITLNEKAIEVLEKASKAVRNIDDEWWRADELVEISRLFAKLGHPVRAYQMLAEGISTIKKIAYDSHRVQSIIKASEVYRILDYKRQAMKSLSQASKWIEKIEEKDLKVDRLLELAEARRKWGYDEVFSELLKEAAETAQNINDSIRKYKRLIEIAFHYTNANKIKEARAIIMNHLRFTDIHKRQELLSNAHLLEDLALLYFKTKQNKKGREFTAWLIQNMKIKGHMEFSSLFAKYLAQLGEYSLAINMVKERKDSYWKASGLCDIAGKVIESGWRGNKNFLKVLRQICV